MLQLRPNRSGLLCSYLQMVGVLFGAVHGEHDVEPWAKLNSSDIHNYQHENSFHFAS